MYPSEHGMIDWSKKSKKIPLMGNLNKIGYKVNGFTSFKFIKQLLQNSIDIECIGTDFDEYWDVNQHLIVTERALNFLAENRRKLFFLFYHHSAPHAPYRFPKNELKCLKNDKEFKSYYKNLKSDRLINTIFPQMNNEELDMIFQTEDEAKKYSSLIAKATTGILKLEKKQADFIRFLYKREVEWTDYLIGRILNKLKKLDLQKNTIICFSADHGELLYEQSKFGHANDYMNNEVIKVPWIIYSPNIKENKIIDSNVSHINIMPTLLEMIGIKLNEKSKKRSLWTELSENKQIVSKPVYSAGKFRIAVIRDNVKYITDSKRESQIICFRDFIMNSLKLLPTLSNSIDEIRNNFILFMGPYYKRLIGIPKEELFEFDSKQNIEKSMVTHKSSLKKEMAMLIDEYYNLEKVDLTEELSEDELRIIKVRLEALGYLVKKHKK